MDSAWGFSLNCEFATLSAVHDFATPGKGRDTVKATSVSRGAKTARCTGELRRGGRRTGEGGSMYRSVIESEQVGSERRRLWRWAEGILVAVVVVVGVTYLFGLIAF